MKRGRKWWWKAELQREDLLRSIPYPPSSPLRDKVLHWVAYGLGLAQGRVLDAIEEPFWRSQDGRITLLKDMGEEHLLNCIRLLRRRKEARGTLDARSQKQLDQLYMEVARRAEVE